MFSISKSFFSYNIFGGFPFFRTNGTAFLTILLQLPFQSYEMINLANDNHVFCKTVILYNIGDCSYVFVLSVYSYIF